jgi:hypothetical protein
VTHIYFALGPDEVSSFHKLHSEEVWNLYRGDGVRLFLWDDPASTLETVDLAPDAGHYCHVVPARLWLAAAPLRGEVLTGCTVAPGFEFTDFELLAPGSDAAARLLARHPDLRRLVHGAG